VTVQYSVSTGANSFTAAAHTAIEINPGSSMPAELVAMDVSSPYLTSGTPFNAIRVTPSATITLVVNAVFEE
jgi:hypothetical protein